MTARKFLRFSLEDGAAAVEFALVLLPLALIVFGTVDVGRAYGVLVQLRNEAQAGAAYALSNPTQVNVDGTTCADPSSAQYQVANEANQGAPGGSSTLPSGYTLTVTDLANNATLSANGSYTGCGPDDAGPTMDSSATCPAARTSAELCPGDTLLVQVSAPFHIITPLIGAVVGSNITLHGTSEVVLP